MTALAAALREALSGRRVCVLGIGSELRRDDGAGMLLLRLLRDRAGEALLLGGATAPENFTGAVRAYGPEVLLAVDAAWMDLPPGEAALLDPEQAGGLPFSTHMLPLSLTLDYLRRETGCALILLGIQPETTEQGLGLSPAVLAGVRRLAALLGDILEANERTGTIG